MNKKRIMAALLSASFMFGSAVSSPASFMWFSAPVSIQSEAAELPYVNWRQTDSRWSSILLGSTSGTSVGQIGCAATSLCCLLAESGVCSTDESEFNPKIGITAMKKAGAFGSGGGITWGTAANAVSKDFKLSTTVSLTGTQAQKLATIKSYYEKGYYIQVKVVCGSQHWVAVRRFIGDKCEIMDTGGTNQTYMSGYTISSSAILYTAPKPAGWRYNQTEISANFYRNLNSDDTKTVTEKFTEGVSNQKFGHKTDGSGRYSTMNQADVGFGAWAKTGYDMLGWNTDRNASAAKWSTYSPVNDKWIKSNSPSINLYAIWKPHVYTVDFDSYGGTLSESTKSVTYDSTYGSLPVAQKDGYTFDGWFTSPDGGTEINDSSKVTIAGNHTLYAHWTEVPRKLTECDCNADGELSISDAVMLQNWLLKADTELTDKESADVYSDGVIDVFDFIELRRLLCEQELKSEWVLESEAPDGAEITDVKWTYDKISIESQKSDTILSDWELVSSEWEKKSDGTNLYANFPAGFDTTNSIYSKYNKSALSVSETESTKREVSASSVKSYIYWHWNYVLGQSGPLDNRYISDKKGSFTTGSKTYNYSHFSAFESSKNLTETDSKGETYKYDTGVYDDVSWWWFKLPVYQQTYTDYKKVYNYTRTVISQKNAESETDPANLENVQNVQKWVRFLK
ncbi:MAG: InlB B-repeat-containing protein [Ruminococcus sp.]|nr:InlB B-repeat-containing protein [Ruminococcus sp.]